jgi:carbon storage regulator CsrA
MIQGRPNNLAARNGTESRVPVQETIMQVLSRKQNESIVLDGPATVTVVEIRGEEVRLSIESPAEFDARVSEADRSFCPLRTSPLSTSSLPGIERGILAELENLSLSALEQFCRAVLSIRASKRALLLSDDETELLLRINRGLPDDQRQRFQHLCAKRDAETLSDKEREEIIQLSDDVEMFQANRLESLARLAGLRQVSLASLMHDMGIATRDHGP